MMWERFQIQSIYLYRQPVDMRKGMDGLSALVSAELGLDPMAPSLFVFTNRGRDKIKLLLWERNGFWVFYKRLVQQKFHWPDWFESDQLALSQEQIDLLLQGFNLNGMRPHNTLSMQHVF
jgi:transposase